MMNELGLYEIYGLSYVPFWQRIWFFWVMVVMSLLIGATVIAVCLRWYRQRKTQRELPYWQEALIQLDLLKKNNVATVVNGSIFYVRLTYIVKEYLERRYGYSVRGRTDKETVAILANADFDPQLLTIVQQIFEGGEYIKFANVTAAQHQIEKDLESSIALIHATYPRPDVK